MKKQVLYHTRGHRADIGSLEIYRMLSNNYVDHVGHFVFLDYIPPMMLTTRRLDPQAAHPHRGIATLTYSLHGELEHFDSRGNRGMVHSGGVQWMKAGNGIVHNEVPGPDRKTGGKLMHGFQFWINLPAKNKKEDPEYMALQSEELPLLPLEDHAGTLKLVLGEYKEHASKIPTFAEQFLYHVRIQPGKQFALQSKPGLEYAAFLPQHDLYLQDSIFHSGDLIGFDDQGGMIEIKNPLKVEAEFLLFGGEKYTEPYYAYGPFVMNTREEIAQAHSDYQNGKYGEIVYQESLV